VKPREFLENLGVSPAATEGTEYLRKVVLALAVRGSLVPQVHAEGTGHDLLSRIRAVAQKAGNVHKARQEEADPSEVAQPFQIPAHWVWACWRDLILSSEAGWSPQCASRPRSGDEWGVLKVSAVSWDRFDPDQNKALLPGVEPRRDCAVRAGDFIMSRANTAALVGRSVVVGSQPTRLLMSDKIVRCHFSPLVDRSFMNYYNRTETARQHYIANASGTSDSMKNISRDVILGMPVPLPPLEEQKRIVAKVDQLMALCDDLEAKQTKKRALATQSTRSALTALTSAETAEDLSTAWHRVVKNFNLTTSDSAAINGLRSAILGLAVRGQLVRDCPRTGGGAPHGPLPQGWHWVKMSEAGDLKLGRQRAPQHHVGPNMRPYLRVANVFEARLDLSDVMEMNFEPEEAERFELRPNDVLLNEGQSTELVGRPAIYRGEIPGVCFQNTLIRFRPSKLVIPEYALTVFRAYMRTGRFQREAQQTTNIAHLSLGRLATVEFPLPPLPEQKRIVAKVDHLMSLLDDLEAKLRKQEETAARLAESLAAAVAA